MTKIFVAKDETIDSVLEKIIEAEESDITLVVPKNAALKESAHGFQRIRVEAQANQKRVVVESVDEEILSLARTSKLEAFHPLFRQDALQRSFSDIVPSGEGVTKKEAKSAPRVPAKPREFQAKTVPEETEESGEKRRIDLKLPHLKLPRAAIRIPRFRRFGFILAAVILLGAATAFVVTKVFGRADITIHFARTPWEFSGSIKASKELNAIDPEKRLLPAELFTQEKNLTKLFPASGRERVSQKAEGTITIYNAYSSQPQSLVATTRFVTPDGKIFRLDKGVTVPGAKINEGKIIPSSIEAAVTSDKAGEEYNVGPVARLSVPGFEGSPKYEGFYGELKEAAKGGFIGERAVPTDEDIRAGRAEVEKLLRSALQVNVLNRFPEDFTILDDASEIEITELTANRKTDDGGNFAIFGKGALRALGFREKDLTELFLSSGEEMYADQTFRELNIDYDTVAADFKKGEVAFAVSAQGMLAAAFDEERFREEILGKKINDIRSLTASLRGLEDAQISFWPFWLKEVPRNAEKVEIVAD